MDQSPPKRRKVSHADDEVIPSEASDAELVETSRDRPRSATTDRKRTTPSEARYHGSDVLQLQISDLLKELGKMRRKRLSAAEALLRQLKGSIEAIPDRPATSPSDGERNLWNEAKVAVPFPPLTADKNVKYTVTYTKPARINVVGSFALDTAFVEKRMVPTIDLAVTIPATLFQDKDYLDHRYFVKRAYYLATIAAGLAASKDLGVSVSYEYQNGNHLQPVLIATPDDAKLKSSFRVRIIAATTAVFAASKTLPSKSCLRIMSKGSSAVSPATPIYNGTLRAETKVEAYLKFLYSTRVANDSFSPACVLINVWLGQRGLGSSLEEGGFGSFEAAVLMAFLLKTGSAHGRPLFARGYNHFQLFKATLQFIATKDLSSDPLIHGECPENVQEQQSGEPLLWDGERAMNVLYKMSRSSYASLRFWARSSLASFDATATDQLDALFVRRCNIWEQRFDDICDLKVNLSRADQSLEAEGMSSSAIYARSAFTVLDRALVFDRALGPRASLIEPSPYARGSWSTRSRHPSSSPDHIRIGFNLEPMHINRIRDLGPSAEDKEAAAAFRRFWGEKSELRRFQDSSILESLIWDEGDDTPAVHRQIIKFICERHLAMPPRFVALDILARDASQDYAHHALSSMSAIWRSYEELQDVFRNLERLPLQIRNFVPMSCKIDNCSEGGQVVVMEIGLQFEGSARWPEDLVAIQRTKLAFLAKLQGLVQTNGSTLRCTLAQENNFRPLLNCAILEVVRLDVHHVFQIRIFHEREPVLLTESLRNQPSPIERQAYSDALAEYNRSFMRKPEQVQALRRLGLQMPLLLPTIMLFKKWCSAHLLDSHLLPELQELIVMRIFTQPEPFKAPVNASVGLFRVLDFLARWDWWNEPLVVNLGEMTATSLQEAATRFDAWRKLDPGLSRTVIFAASDMDLDGTTWTYRSPSKATASRLTALAGAAVARIDLHNLESRLQDIFATGLGDYDFVIHLSSSSDKEERPSHSQLIYKNLRSSGADVQNQGHPTSQSFIGEVTQLFSDVMVLFHDLGRRPVVAGMWMPCAPKPWKATLDYSPLLNNHGPGTSSSEDDCYQAVVNRNAILNEIARLGGDLVSKIEPRR